jgi:hypothetical protein
MSTTLLYHVFGIGEYKHVRAKYENDQVIFTAPALFERLVLELLRRMSTRDTAPHLSVDGDSIRSAYRRFERFRSGCADVKTGAVEDGIGSPRIAS